MLVRLLSGMLAIRCCRSRATAFVFNANSQVLRRGVSRAAAAAAAVEPRRRVLLTCRGTSRSDDSHSVLSPVRKRHVNIWWPWRGGVGMYSSSSSSALHGGRRGGGGGRGGGRGRGGRRSPNYGPARAGQHRNNVSPGTSVEVVQKQHQQTGELTTGVVSRLLTSSGFHPRGIKVMLSGGVVGRVQNVVGVDEAAASTNSVPESLSRGGYSSSSSSSNNSGGGGGGGGGGGVIGGSIAHSDDHGLGASTQSNTGRGRRQISTAAGGEGAAAAAAAAPARSARPIRTFRAERVQGRSWSLEGGEVVARGAGGEEIPGAAAGGRSDFDGRRGRRGRRGRGGRR